MEDQKFKPAEDFTREPRDTATPMPKETKRQRLTQLFGGGAQTLTQENQTSTDPQIGPRDSEEPLVIEGEGLRGEGEPEMLGRPEEQEMHQEEDQQVTGEALIKEADRRVREEESLDRLAKERRKRDVKYEQSRRERVARQEKVIQEKQTKEQLAKEQARTKELTREEQERHIEQDQEMRRKRTTQIGPRGLAGGETGARTQESRTRPNMADSEHQTAGNQTEGELTQIAHLNPDSAGASSPKPTDTSTEALGKRTVEDTTPSGEKGSHPHKIRIYLKIFDGGDWKDLRPYDVDPSKPSDFMRAVRKWTRKDIKKPLNVFAGSRMITPLTRFEDIIAGGNDTLRITSETEIDTDNHSDPRLPPESDPAPPRKKNRS
jgi:hypothetical protein